MKTNASSLLRQDGVDRTSKEVSACLLRRRMKRGTGRLRRGNESHLFKDGIETGHKVCLREAARGKPIPNALGPHPSPLLFLSE